MGKPGIAIDVPGFGKRHILIAVSDYTGTHSFGGAIAPDVKSRLRELATLVDLHIVTADSFGTAENELAGIALPYKLRTGRHDHEKADYVSRFDLQHVAVPRVPVAELADPVNRLAIRYPSGLAGPAFRAGGMLVWGFTALLVDRLLALGGWELPWDAGSPQDLPASALGQRPPA